jgi:hypothetical protein
VPGEQAGTPADVRRRYLVAVAGTRADGLARARDELPAVILLDLRLPDQ